MYSSLGREIEISSKKQDELRAFTERCHKLRNELRWRDRAVITEMWVKTRFKNNKLFSVCAYDPDTDTLVILPHQLRTPIYIQRNSVGVVAGHNFRTVYRDSNARHIREELQRYVKDNVLEDLASVFIALQSYNKQFNNVFTCACRGVVNDAYFDHFAVQHNVVKMCLGSSLSSFMKNQLKWSV